MKCNVCLDTATANSLINCQLSDVITYTALRFHICDLTLMTASAFEAMYNLISKIYGMSILMEKLSYKSSNIKPGIQVGKLTVNDLKFILTRRKEISDHNTYNLPHIMITLFTIIPKNCLYNIIRRVR